MNNIKHLYQSDNKYCFFNNKKTHEDVRFEECPSCQPLPCIFQTGGNAGKLEAKQGGSKIGLRPSTAFASTLHCCLVHACVCRNLGRGVLWCPVQHFQLAHGQEAPPAPPYGREAPYALRPHTGAEEINGG